MAAPLHVRNDWSWLTELQELRFRPRDLIRSSVVCPRKLSDGSKRWDRCDHSLDPLFNVEVCTAKVFWQSNLGRCLEGHRGDLGGSELPAVNEGPVPQTKSGAKLPCISFSKESGTIGCENEL